MGLNMNQKVNIVDVDQRDKFQNLCNYILIYEKLQFISCVENAGLNHIQIKSLVNPKSTP